MSKFRGVKTDNAKTQAKRDIREFTLHNIRSAHVLEVYCGGGEMYRDIWREADSYTGVDNKKYFDERHTICGDAEKVVSAIDLGSFNVFDIDAYGSPYEVLDIITNRIRASEHKKIGFVITDGIEMDLKLGRICKGLRLLTGINMHIVKRAHVIHDDLISSVIARVSERLQMKVDAVKIARGKTGASMRYYAFLLSC